MSTMRPGERVVRCLVGAEVDRAPYGVGIGWQTWGSTTRRWRAESGIVDLNIKEHFGFDNSFYRPAIEYGIFPRFESKVLEEDQNYKVVRDEHGIVKRVAKHGVSMPQFLANPVQNMTDWRRLKEERLNPKQPGRLAEDWSVLGRRLEESGEVVQVGRYPYGVFGMPRDLMGAEELLVAFYEQPDLIHDMMEHLTTLWIHLWTETAKYVRIDHIHIWEDMSGRHGSLISPAMVREFMMPCYDRIAAFARTHGVRLVSVDTDGACGELLPVFQEHGVNMVFPFEVQAGNDIEFYRQEYPALGILGGLDKRALAIGPKAIDLEVEKARRRLTHGRYIPCFDHLIPDNVSWDNFRYAAEALRSVCYGAGG